MALVTPPATETICLKKPFANLQTLSFPIAAAATVTSGFLPCALSATRKERRGLLCLSFALKDEVIETTDGAQQVEEEEEEEEMEEPQETLLYSISPLPLPFVAALPGGMIFIMHHRHHRHHPNQPFQSPCQNLLPIPQGHPDQSHPCLDLTPSWIYQLD